VNVVEILSFVQTLPLVAKLLISVVVALIAGVILVIVWTPGQVREKKNTVSRPPDRIEQRTTGDNSPAIQGVEGDLNLNIGQNKSEKDTKEK
jgi:hypothetical protein